MSCKLGVGAVLIGLALVGCKGSQPASAASGGGAGSGGSAEGSGGASAAAGGAVTAKVAYITDPTLNNMNAVGVKIPSRWQFTGSLFQGDSCESVPLAIFKSTSPDGVTTVEQEPGMAWKWGSGPEFDRMPKGDCLPLHGPMSAQDYLKRFAATMKLNYVGPDQVPAALQAKEQKKADDSDAEMAPRWASLHATPPKSTFELGRAIVTSQKGTVAMKGRMDVKVNCMESNFAGHPEVVGRPPRMTTGPSSTVDKCWATVTYLNAPEAKYDEVARAFDAAQLGTTHMEDSWAQAWEQRLSAQTQRTMQIIGQMSRQAMQAQQQQFNHDQEVRQDMHNQFMNAQQQNFDQHQAGVAANLAARDASTSDWVDYAGDRQTVRDTTTGVIYKESNQLPVGGNEVQVHGNGTPW
jgi:hypothetical protein